jgi:hypothetical protein
MKTIGNNFKTGTVVAVAFSGGGPRYAVRVNNGAIYRDVPLRAQGTSFYPVKVGQSVHLLFPAGAYDLPYIIGSDMAEVERETSDAGVNEDYSPDSADLQIKHEGSTLSLSESGVTVDSSTARFQLGDSGLLRVSKNGSAGQQVLNADGFLDELYTYIAELELTITALQAHVVAMSIQLGTETLPTSAPAKRVLSPSTASKIRAQGQKNEHLRLP